MLKVSWKRIVEEVSDQFKDQKVPDKNYPKETKMLKYLNKTSMLSLFTKKKKTLYQCMNEKPFPRELTIPLEIRELSSQMISLQ
jgi:hypothetical protein